MSQRQAIEHLRRRSPLVLPSLLLCDFANLASELRSLEEAGVAAFHLDVMDGHFVPNLTYGMPIVEACRRSTDCPLDVHLMISEPERYVEDFHKAGADILTVHLEAIGDRNRAIKTLDHIRSRGAAVGVAINPATPLDAGNGLWELCDLILVMSVPAGFGGQKFDPVALRKLAELRDKSLPNVILEVDGGINEQTIADCSQAGADWFVVGSAIFRTPDYSKAVRDLSGLAKRN